jgi:hypothetical protein
VESGWQSAGSGGGGGGSSADQLIGTGAVISAAAIAVAKTERLVQFIRRFSLSFVLTAMS